MQKNISFSITLSLKTENQLKSKYAETDWFPAISVSFGWEFHKPKYNIQFRFVIPIKTDWNQIEHTPRFCCLLFCFDACERESVWEKRE